MLLFEQEVELTAPTLVPENRLLQVSLLTNSGEQLGSFSPFLVPSNVG